MSSSPLALRDNARLAQSSANRAAHLRSGSHAVVQTQTGSVAVLFALESYDQRQRVAVYSLRVFNDSNALLVCRVGVVSQQGDAALAYPVPLQVEPFSVKSTEVPVWLSDFDSFSHAIVEVAGGDVRCVVEAAAPIVKPKRRFSEFTLAAAGLTFGLVTLAVAASGTVVPRIAAFAVPPMALNGTTVQAEYAATGFGTLSYAVTAPDGRRIAGGALDQRSGIVPVAIPTSHDAGAYTIQLSMQGPFGSASELRVLNATPKVAQAVGGGARVANISVNPLVAKPGQTINVAYAATGSEGYVRLLGTDGTIWAQEPFSHGGSTQLTIPALPGERELRVLLHVTRGSSTAESSAGIVVLAPAPPASVQPAPQVVGDNQVDSAADGYANGTFQVLSPTISSGGTIRVQILSPRNGMRISLTDTQSNEVTGVNVGTDQQTVSLRAPEVRVATRYTVVASFTDGFGQESVVQPVTIAP